MKLQVQIRKQFSMEILRSQLDRVKGEHISYFLAEKDKFYALDVQYDSLSAYHDFMLRLHDLWRSIA
jgi:hypothetical protein